MLQLYKPAVSLYIFLGLRNTKKSIVFIPNLTTPQRKQNLKYLNKKSKKFKKSIEK